MNGPDHHREAEHLIKLAREAGIQGPRIPTPTRINIGGGPDIPDIPDYGKLYTDEDSDPRCRNLLAEAQVHATLALAAALQESRPDRTSRPAAATPRPEPASPDVPFIPTRSTVEFGGAYPDPRPRGPHDTGPGETAAPGSSPSSSRTTPGSVTPWTPVEPNPNA